jgi:hypothetical protein
MSLAGQVTGTVCDLHPCQSGQLPLDQFACGLISEHTGLSGSCFKSSCLNRKMKLVKNCLKREKGIREL